MDKNKGQAIFMENMTVLYVVLDYSHVLRLDSPVSLQPIVDSSMTNSNIKHPQSENDKIKPFSEIMSFF